MIATWSPDIMCNPHDHGGSWSTIFVLEGSARHELYRINNFQLKLTYVEEYKKGSFLERVPSQIHAMGDSGNSENNLVTLHAYSKSIPYMMIYDVENNRTLRVDGSCGAWIPDHSKQIIQQYEGILQ